MIRRSRLIKVVFGSSAVIFILLQFLETSVSTSNGSSGSTKLPTSSKLISKNLTKDISSAVVVSPNLNKTTQDIGNVLLDETNKEVKNTLSGERIHGLPNETLTAHCALVIEYFQPFLYEIKRNINNPVFKQKLQRLFLYPTQTFHTF